MVGWRWADGGVGYEGFFIRVVWWGGRRGARGWDVGWWWGFGGSCVGWWVLSVWAGGEAGREWEICHVWAIVTRVEMKRRWRIRLIGVMNEKGGEHMSLPSGFMKIRQSEITRNAEGKKLLKATNNLIEVKRHCSYTFTLYIVIASLVPSSALHFGLRHDPVGSISTVLLFQDFSALNPSILN